MVSASQKETKMKKHLKLSPLYFISILLFISCTQLNNIANTPKISPELFLQNQHWIKIQIAGYNFIWSQPSSTVIVYFVGLFSIYTGYSFLHNRQKQQSKLWWGIGLLLSGLGALFGGTSYQAFGYEIKCNGRDICTWTSWWEVVYLLLSVSGMNAFLIAASYTNTKGKFRKAIIVYSLFNTIAYTILLLYGALTPIKFAVSFEYMTLISAPSVIFLLVLHSTNYGKQKDEMNLFLRNSGFILIAVGIAYSVYLSYEIRAFLWQKGIWFTENDVLHLGMIGWVYYILRKARPLINDLNCRIKKRD